MKCKIMHESVGRVRVRLLCGRMTLQQADILEYYLKGYGYVRIAEMMGKTPKSFDNALQRIRGKIRNFSLSFWDKQ